jgi:hypothetical protein
MTEFFDDKGDIDWKRVIMLLNDGKVIEIPCDQERECERRAMQMAKRAEKRGLVIETVRAERALRVTAQKPESPADADDDHKPKSRKQRRAERAQRRNR